jgi:hypothetical protein
MIVRSNQESDVNILAANGILSSLVIIQKKQFAHPFLNSKP